nr:hypothetical protein Iba_chr04fCG13960 [Ipomoea batatas]
MGVGPSVDRPGMAETSRRNEGTVRWLVVRRGGRLRWNGLSNLGRARVHGGSKCCDQDRGPLAEPASSKGGTIFPTGSDVSGSGAVRGRDALVGPSRRHPSSMLSSSGALPSFPSPSRLAATMVGLRPNGSSNGQNSGDQFGYRFSDAIAQFSDCLGFVQRVAAASSGYEQRLVGHIWLRQKNPARRSATAMYWASKNPASS